MTTIPGATFPSAQYPYATVEFDEDGNRVGSQPTLPAEVTDVVIISHGWNNSRAEAQELYETFFASFGSLPNALDPRRTGVVGVFWPSKKYQVEAATGAGNGGAAALGAPDESIGALSRQLDELRAFFTAPGQQQALESLKALLPDLEEQPAARVRFVGIIRDELLQTHAGDEEDGSAAFFEDDPDEIMKRLRTVSTLPPPDPRPEGMLGFAPPRPRSNAVEEAVAQGNFFGGFFAAARNILDYTTYYENKTRAGNVGRRGLAPVIDQLPQTVKRVHLIGHSFGARLVTAAAHASTTTRVATLSLLQAAFSHNGFSREMGGVFRSVVDQKRVAGPIIVTHTANDRAVGFAYPIASRLANDSTRGLGDANDRFGGLGRNGVQKMGPTEREEGALLKVGGAYPFRPGVFFNLEASEFIPNHGGVAGQPVAYAVQQAIASVQRDPVT